MIEVTSDKIKINDSLHGFNYECNISPSNCFYDNNSIVFCEEDETPIRKIFLYKNGELTKLAQSTDARILYANTNLDQIVFIVKGDNTTYDFMDLYVYEHEAIKPICHKVNITGTKFFIVDNEIVMTYLIESHNKSTYRSHLWNLFATDLHGTVKLIESDIKEYSAFLTKENKIKYIICKWSNTKVKHYAGYFDEDFDWLVVKTGRKSKKFPMGYIGDHFISLQGKLVLLKSVEMLHDGDPNDVYFLKRKNIYSLSLINTDTFEEVFIDKTDDSQIFRFTNYLYFAGEFIDTDHTARHGISIGPHLIEKYSHYFKSGSAKIPEYPYTAFFSKTSSKTYFVAMELALKADRLLVVDSPYPLDDSQNYIVSYNSESEFSAMTALLGNMVHSGSNIKFKIFGIDVFDLMRCCSGEFSWGINNDLEYYRYMQDAILELKKYYKTKSSIQIRKFLQTEFVDKYGLYVPGVPPDKNIYKTLYKEIEHNLINQKRLPAKWKSEQDLYRLISSIFDDAIFHYNDSWIKPQHFDVYVPKLRCAFEYQGKQHYSNIEYFGGEESFKKRLLLDERKRNLCTENSVTLIEWYYDEPITKLVLYKKLKNSGLDITSRIGDV